MAKFTHLVQVFLFSIFVVGLVGCSTSGSNVRSVAVEIDRESAQGVRIAIVPENLQLSSQEAGDLYTLLSSEVQVISLARQVARYYGFTVVPEADAEFILTLKSAVPDGGACVGGVDAAELNVSYSISLLTLGAFPATGVHCLVITADLYSNAYGQKELMGEFVSNKGEVEVIGGINSIKHYQRHVRLIDERKGLEASFGSMLNEIIDAGAFLE